MDNSTTFELEPETPIDQSITGNVPLVLPPFPQDQLRSNYVVRDDRWGFDRALVEWPESIIPPTPDMRRTKSFINMTTTIAGVGQMSLSSKKSGMIPRNLAVGNDNPLLIPSEYPEIDYLQLTLQASTRIYDIASETPLTFAKNFSAKLGSRNKVYFKREDLQPSCFSFKLRGAYNLISQLTREEREKGVICMSAGNHAQGVALAARYLGIKATIVMPTSAPEIKISSVRRMGATVVLSGVDLEGAKRECMNISDETGAIFIPPFDNPYIIAGQGTCGMEILRQIERERVDAIFIPVGGGGLLAGIAAFVKRVQPDVRIVGVNTVDSDGMSRSLHDRKLSALKSVGLFSDGTAVRQIGNETYRICRNLVDDMVLVTVDEICAAIKDVFIETRSIVEPAGALAVAGVKRYLTDRGKNVEGAVLVAVLTGANMNFDRLRFVCERSRIGEGSECLLSCKIPEEPGSFLSLYMHIYPRNVTEISYRYTGESLGCFFVSVEVPNGREDARHIVDEINGSESSNMNATDITDDELAKSHLRFFAGGRLRQSEPSNEKIYRFKYGERPGAMKQFLERLNQVKWNLTMMHYRNTGGDLAKMLIGLDVSKNDEESGRLGSFLKEFGYEYQDETDNPSYANFLK